MNNHSTFKTIAIILRACVYDSTSLHASPFAMLSQSTVRLIHLKKLSTKRLKVINIFADCRLTNAQQDAFALSQLTYHY